MGYQFYNKQTGDMIPKYEIFATYFRGQYTTDGQTIEPLTPSLGAKFDQIALEYQGKIVKVNRHPHYAIRDQRGWKDGRIECPKTFFIKSGAPGAELAQLKDMEGTV